MMHSLLDRLFSRRFIPIAVLLSFVLFTGATFILPDYHPPLSWPDFGKGPASGSVGVFPVQGNVVTHARSPVLQRMEEMILTQRALSVSV